MKFVVVPLVAVFFGALRVNSLKCYQCAASPSSDDCSAQETQVTCAAYLNYCGTVKVQVESGGISAAAIVKGCLTDDLCNGNLPDVCTEGYECDIKCCSTDLCNGENEVDVAEGSSAEALSCKQCLSSTSMEDCIEWQEDKQCSPEETRCGIMSAQTEDQTVFVKGCIPEKLCSTYCKGGFNEEGGFECELSCCEGDFCNAGHGSVGAR